MVTKPHGSFVGGVFFGFCCLSFKRSTYANLCETYINKFANFETEFVFSPQATKDAMFTASYLKESRKENIPRSTSAELDTVNRSFRSLDLWNNSHFHVVTPTCINLMHNTVCSFPFSKNAAVTLYGRVEFIITWIYRSFLFDR